VIFIKITRKYEGAALRELHLCPIKITSTMKKTVLVFGLIAGAIASSLMAINMSMMKPDSDHGAFSMMVGYASMLLGFCFIFLAIKSYRDKQLGGTISFGKAFLTGMWVALIASVCYTITWVIIYKNFYPDFMSQYMNAEVARLQRSGKSAAAIADEIKDMKKMEEMYNTWPGLIGMTMAEILPLGLLVSLISALILKRKAVDPAQQLA
jgi:hypothetical protein